MRDSLGTVEKIESNGHNPITEDRNCQKYRQCRIKRDYGKYREYLSLTKPCPKWSIYTVQGVSCEKTHALKHVYRRLLFIDIVTVRDIETVDNIRTVANIDNQ